MATPDTTSRGLKALIGTMIGLTTVTLALRFFSRRRQRLQLLADDWFVVPAWVAFVSSCICYIELQKLKFVGYSSLDVPKDVVAKNLEKSQKINIASQVLFTFALGCVKASALFFYQRVFCVSGRKATFNIIIVLTLVLLALWTAAYIVFLGVQCKDHFSALWDGTQPQHCQWAFPVIYGEAVSDFIFGVWILALPIPLIVRLHTTRARKLSLVFIFTLACAGVAASLARLVIYTQIQGTSWKEFQRDHEKYITQVGFYMILEIGIGLVAICLPSIWALSNTAGPESLVRSIRSAVSLGSLRSHSSGGSKAVQHKTAVNDSPPRQLSAGGQSANAFHAGPENQSMKERPSNHIHVEQTISQEVHDTGQV